MLETAAMIVELNKAFDCANKQWWEGKLPTPMIIVSRKTSKWELGYITVSKVWVEKKPEDGPAEGEECPDEYVPETRYEINISAEGLNRSMEEILCTLVHECVHLYHFENNIKDTSQKIHNKNFKHEAERVGLHVERGQGVGFGCTSPTEEFITIIKDWDINADPFKFVRIEMLKDKSKNKKAQWIYKDPNDEKRKFKCKFDITVVDKETGERWDKSYEDEDGNVIDIDDGEGGEDEN